MTLPVFIITGFLGAGKTTLLNRLLADPALHDSAVIVNEFGEIGLDHLIVAAPTENTILLQSGCLCCTVLGELTTTLLDLERRRRDGTVPAFARVLVETTGLADPVPILQSLLGDDAIAATYHVGAVITLVDGFNGPDQLDHSFELQKQVATADRIVLSKADLRTEQEVASLEARLSRINPGASFARAAHGELDFAALIDAVPPRGNDWWADSAATAGASLVPPDAGGTQIFRHGAIRTFSIAWDAPASQAGLLTWLHMLASFKGPDLLRMKGIVNVEGRPVLVNAVQRLIHEPVTLGDWPSDDRASRIVFITRAIERAEIEPTLVALQYEKAPPTYVFDPARYADFVKMAQRFQAPSGSTH